MYRGFILLLIFQTLQSCTSESIVDSKSFSFERGWDFENKIAVDFNSLNSIKDALDVSLRLEYQEEFPFENIYLRTTIISQKDTLLREVKSYLLQNEVGQWTGKKSRKGFKIKLPLIKKIKPSDLRIEVEQFSREQTLQGIESAEIILEY